MIALLQTTVPRCPKCASMLSNRIQNGSLYHICVDCKSIFEISGEGQADMELFIKDITKSDG